jgi:hypothetical protein
MSLPEEIMKVDAKIIVGERKKRPHLYSKALSSLLSNPALLDADFVRKALERRFLKLVASEALVRNRSLQLRLLNELALGEDRSMIQLMGLNHLETYASLLKGELKAKSIGEDVLTQFEESSRYGAMGSVEKARSTFINKLLLLSEEDDVGKSLQPYLHLASTPSSYHVQQPLKPQCVAVSWPYIILFNQSGKSIEIRLLGSPIAKYDVAGLMGDGFLEASEKIVMNDGAIFILKGHERKVKAIVARYRSNPFVVEGNAVTYDRINELIYVLNTSRTSAGIHLRLVAYDLMGNVVLSREVKGAMDDFTGARGFECPGGGALFVVDSREESLLIYGGVADNVISTLKVSKPRNVILLPLRIAVLFNDEGTSVIDLHNGEMIGSYSSSLKLKDVAVAYGVGLLGFTDKGIYVIDALNNVYETVSVEDYDRPIVLNTYSFALIGLLKEGEVKELIIAGGGRFHKIKPEQLGATRVIEVQYNKATLSLITKGGLVLSLSPSFVEGLLRLPFDAAQGGRAIMAELKAARDSLGAMYVEQALGKLHSALTQLKSKSRFKPQELDLRPNLRAVVSKAVKRIKVHGLIPLAISLEEVASSIARFSSLLSHYEGLALSLVHITEPRLDLASLAALSETLRMLVEEGRDAAVKKAAIKVVAMRERVRIEPRVLSFLLSRSSDLWTHFFKGLVSIREESMDPAMRENAEKVLSEMGYDMKALNERFQATIRLCNLMNIDKSIMDDMASTITEYVREGELDRALNILDRLTSFLETAHGRELELRKRYGDGLLSYADVREFVSRCIRDVLRGGDATIQWADRLRSYETMLIENVEMEEEVRSSLSNSKLIDGEGVIKDVISITSLKEKNIKLRDLKNKLDSLIMAEGEFNILMDNFKNLTLKPKSIYKQIDFIRGAISSLSVDEALSGVKALRDHIEKLSYINNALLYIDRLKEKMHYGSEVMLLLKSSVLESVSKGDIADAHRKAKLVEEAERLSGALESIINSISLKLSAIDVPREVVESTVNLVLSEAINNFVKGRNLSEIVLKAQAIKTYAGRMSEIVTRLRAQTEDLAEVMKQAGLDSSIIESLKSNIQADINHLVSSARAESFNALCGGYQGALGGLIKMSNELAVLKQNLTRLSNFMGDLHPVTSSFLKDHLNNMMKLSQSVTASIINDLCLKILSSANTLNTVDRLVTRLNELQPSSRAIKNLVSLMNKRLLGNIFAYDVESMGTLAMKLMKYSISVDPMLRKLEELGLDLTESINEQYKLGLDLCTSYLKGVSSLLAEVDANDNRQLLVANAMLLKVKKPDEECVDSFKLIRDLIKWAPVSEADVRCLVDEWIKEVEVGDASQTLQLVRKLTLHIGRNKLKLIHLSDLEALYLTGLEYLGESIHGPSAGRQIKHVDVAHVRGKYAAKAVEHYRVKGDLGMAMLYGLLSYATKDPDYDIAFNALGGAYRNELNLLLDEISKTLSINLTDRHVITLRYIVSPLLKGDLMAIDRFIDDLRAMITEVHNYVNLVKLMYNEGEAVKAIDIIERLRVLREIGRNPASLSIYLYRHISVETFSEVEPYRQNELTLNIYNNGFIPVAITNASITYGNVPLSEPLQESLRMGPYSMEKLKLVIHEIPLEEGWEGREVKLLVSLQISVPELSEIAKTDITLLLPKLIPVAIRTFTPRSGLHKIYEILKKKMKEIELPERLSDALWAIGGNNVVLIGYHKSMNKKVAIKIPGVIVDRIAKHGLSMFTLKKEIDEVVKRYIEATKGCDNVAKIIEVSFDPPLVLEEFIEGTSLRRELNERGRLSVGEALSIISEVGKALLYLHSKGIYHNDVRPENVILTSAGKPLLIDVGVDEIWRRLVPTTVAATERSDKGVGKVIPYFHPELSRRLLETPLAEEERIKGKMDVFQLGLLLYELLTGCNPYIGGVGELVPPSVIASTPKELDDIILRVASREGEPELSLEDFVQNIDRLRGGWRHEGA